MLVKYKQLWTTEEDEMLCEYAGVYRIDTIAKKLNRTPLAVERRLDRLGLTDLKGALGYVTAFELANILNLDSHTIMLWIKKYNLPHLRKVVRYSRKFYLIDPATFWEWAEDNKEKVNFHKFPRNTLPPEPEWVDHERKNTKIPKRRQHNWTKEEDELLRYWRRRGLTRQEIGEKLGRSTFGVKKRITKLGLTKEV